MNGRLLSPLHTHNEGKIKSQQSDQYSHWKQNFGSLLWFTVVWCSIGTINPHPVVLLMLWLYGTAGSSKWTLGGIPLLGSYAAVTSKMLKLGMCSKRNVESLNSAHGFYQEKDNNCELKIQWALNGKVCQIDNQEITSILQHQIIFHLLSNSLQQLATLKIFACAVHLMCAFLEVIFARTECFPAHVTKRFELCWMAVCQLFWQKNIHLGISLRSKQIHSLSILLGSFIEGVIKSSHDDDTRPWMECQS